MFVSVRPMPIPESRSVESGQSHPVARKLLLPALPADSPIARDSALGIDLLTIPAVHATPRSTNPQVLEAAIVRLGNEEKSQQLAPVKITVEPRERLSQKTPATAKPINHYRPRHMSYQATSHAIIDGQDFRKKLGFSFIFSWHDIFVFCLVVLFGAVMICSIQLLFL